MYAEPPVAQPEPARPQVLFCRRCGARLHLPQLEALVSRPRDLKSAGAK